MFLPLLDYLAESYGPFRVFNYLTFRAILSTLTALVFCLFFGNPIIYPGDKIIINKKPEKEKSESSFQDEFLRVFGVVSTTLTTILLVTKL